MPIEIRFDNDPARPVEGRSRLASQHFPERRGLDARRPEDRMGGDSLAAIAAFDGDGIGLDAGDHGRNANFDSTIRQRSSGALRDLRSKGAQDPIHSTHDNDLLKLAHLGNAFSLRTTY